MPDLCCNRVPLIERWHHDSLFCEPVYICGRCGRSGYREAFDRGASELDRRLHLPTAPPRQQTRFTREFRRDAVARVMRGDKSRVAVAVELGVSYEVLGSWVREEAGAGASAARAVRGEV